MTTLSERAMLTSLSISQWTARKLDRQETTAVNRSHGLTIEAARVNKDLFPLAVSLERVHKTTRAIRSAFDAYTLPWLNDGQRVLKASAYLDFVQLVTTWKTDFNSAVDDFVNEYPTLLHDAEVMLGTLFKADDYPSHEHVRSRFRIDVGFMPVPSKDDWRIDIGDEAKRRLEQEITARVMDAEAQAMQEAWRRIFEVVRKAHERLRDPDAIFKDSLVGNAVELCGLLPMLNVADDPQLEARRQELERALAPYHGRVDALRHDPDARRDATDAMQSILDKMAGAYA